MMPLGKSASETNRGNREYEEVERLVRQNLDVEYNRLEEITLRTNELETICTIAITALIDHSPALGELLLTRAEQVFGKKVKMKSD